MSIGILTRIRMPLKRVSVFVFQITVNNEKCKQILVIKYSIVNEIKTI